MQLMRNPKDEHLCLSFQKDEYNAQNILNDEKNTEKYPGIRGIGLYYFKCKIPGFNRKPMKKGTPDFKYVEKIATLLDSKYRIPGTRFRFGLDPVIGLLPFAGDAVTFLISSGLVLIMIRNGASGKVVVKMVGNVLLDTIIGSIPLIGSVFDFFYKANNRNVRLLKKHYEEGKYKGSGMKIIIIVGIMLLLLFILFIYLTIALIIWLAGLL
jgi:hypothetical protein